MSAGDTFRAFKNCLPALVLAYVYDHCPFLFALRLAVMKEQDWCICY